MTLYLYRMGTPIPVTVLKNVRTYTGGEIVTADAVYSPIAEDLEFSSLPDCSETLRADWNDAHPSDRQRLEELEELLAQLLFGGDQL